MTIPTCGGRPQRQARAQAQTQHPILDSNLIPDLNSKNESSDDDSDDEGISNVSPPKRSDNPNLGPLACHKGRYLELDNDRHTPIGRPKRWKFKTMVDSAKTNSRLTPTSFSPTSRLDITTASLDENRDLSPDSDAPPIGLLTRVNAVLRKEEQGDQQSTTHPNHPPSGQISPPDADDAQPETEDGQGDVQKTRDQYVTDASTHDQDPIISISEDEDEREEYDEQEVNGRDDNIPTEDQSQIDIWEVPESPSQQLLATQPAATNTLGAILPQKRRLEVHIPSRRIESNQSTQPCHDRPTKRPRIASRDNHAALLVPIGSDVEVDVQNDASEKIDDNHSEYAGENFAGDGNLSDIDTSTEESFAEDVTKFRAQYPQGYEGDETFDGPSEDDDLAVLIRPFGLKAALLQMCHPAWAGLKRGWHQRSFDIDASETEPVKALLRFLARFERLLGAAPVAPRITEQNVFLNEYSDVLTYYFSKIKLVIQYIRHILVERKSGESGINGHNEERDKISEEIGELVIPMLFHTLASAWNLGGYDWQEAAFTISTMELLRRALSWIGLLYRPLLQQMRLRSFDTSENLTEHERRKQLATREKRAELDEVLKELYRVVNTGLDEHEKVEHQREQDRQDRLNRLNRQKEIMVKREKEELERKKAIEERKWRSLMSVRGIHTPLSQSSVPSSARESLAPQAPPQAPSQASPQMRPQKPSPSLDTSEWSLEEKTCLFKKIQMSYPDLVDLDDIRWELDRTLEETEAMSEEILRLMLEAVHPEQEVAERNAHVQEVMQNYRRTWGH